MNEQNEKGREGERERGCVWGVGGVSLFTSFNGLCKQALNTVLSSGIRA